MPDTQTSYEPVARDPAEHSAAHPDPKPPRLAYRAPIRVLLFAATFCLVALAVYKANRWSVDLAITSEHTSGTTVQEEAAEITGKPEPENDSEMPRHGKYSVGYFVNWGIYGRKFPPSLIPAENLTHILYAFANIRGDTGEVVLSDTWSDQEIHYPGDSWNDIGHNLYGNFKAIYKLKQANRHLKVLLSIGGWTYSPTFHPIVVSPALRSKFVASAIRLLEDNGLDGLDIDYEYPQNDAQARGYLDLLRELRAGLDAHAARKRANYKFLLTIAAPCGPQNYQKLHAREMDQYLDFWNLMAYDFAGSWDSIANHQANLFGGQINASQSVQWYMSKGIASDKLILGIPLYGRSFMNTDGPGTSFQGIGQGSWEQGVYDYRALPLPGSYLLRDERAVASWGYNYQSREMVSFDSEEVGHWKGQWIARSGLGGSMFWELSGDKGSTRDGMEGGPGKDPQPGRSLVAVVKEAMGELDRSPNWLHYEGSQFDNLRNGTI
ncbi:glycoside hydrolase family 18 protein [Laetiporus sulphureus 93-53]|uniref:chitinase n=1 Tax=Laetiporus sulphureus 93-53 TaxID=1314785 RepID=A0A165F3S3_9APHY|nr:glycoside hydrolase family 18 protein [Laetiporus sulphureus 93-53]KZT08322.1 glycoside hydrolase family 18 protein [Laetiporus sulphureus 93-53]